MDMLARRMVDQIWAEAKANAIPADRTLTFTRHTKTTPPATAKAQTKTAARATTPVAKSQARPAVAKAKPSIDTAAIYASREADCRGQRPAKATEAKPLGLDAAAIYARRQEQAEVWGGQS